MSRAHPPLPRKGPAFSSATLRPSHRMNGRAFILRGYCQFNVVFFYSDLGFLSILFIFYIPPKRLPGVLRSILLPPFQFAPAGVFRQNPQQAMLEVTESLSILLGFPSSSFLNRRGLRNIFTDAVVLPLICRPVWVAPWL